jgi:hypothetical protein
MTGPDERWTPKSPKEPWQPKVRIFTYAERAKPRPWLLPVLLGGVFLVVGLVAVVLHG